LTSKIKGLSQEQLGNVRKMLENIFLGCENDPRRMPKCLERSKNGVFIKLKVEKDRYQILVDNIRKETFNKIDEYI
jgi:hypothetical protein